MIFFEKVRIQKSRRKTSGIVTAAAIAATVAGT
jgi:hypothetical protein